MALQLGTRSSNNLPHESKMQTSGEGAVVQNDRILESIHRDGQSGGILHLFLCPGHSSPPQQDMPLFSRADNGDVHIAISRPVLSRAALLLSRIQEFVEALPASNAVSSLPPPVRRDRKLGLWSLGRPAEKGRASARRLEEFSELTAAISRNQGGTD